MNSTSASLLSSVEVAGWFVRTVSVVAVFVEVVVAVVEEAVWCATVLDEALAVAGANTSCVSAMRLLLLRGGKEMLSMERG